MAYLFQAGDYSILSPYSGSTAYGDLSPQVMTWGARGPMARGRLTRMHSYNAEFLNLPGFFEKELKRSKDFRKRLNATDANKPTDV